MVVLSSRGLSGPSYNRGAILRTNSSHLLRAISTATACCFLIRTCRPRSQPCLDLYAYYGLGLFMGFARSVFTFLSRWVDIVSSEHLNGTDWSYLNKSLLYLVQPFTCDHLLVATAAMPTEAQFVPGRDMILDLQFKRLFVCQPWHLASYLLIAVILRKIDRYSTEISFPQSSRPGTCRCVDQPP